MEEQRRVNKKIDNCVEDISKGSVWDVSGSQSIGDTTAAAAAAVVMMI